MVDGAVALPASAPAPAEIEGLIGEVLVAVAAVSVQAWQEVREDGRMRNDTKQRGGNLIAQLYTLQTTIGAINFAAIMRQQSRLRLCHRNGVDLSEATADAITDDLLAIVAHVSTTMQAGAN